MPDTTPSPGNAPGLPSGSYLEALQEKALKLEVLLKVIVFLEIEPEMSEARVILGEIVTSLASELYAGLDKGNLPKGTIA